MQISPISQSQIQSKPSFEGTVHKSVIKFIDDAVRQEMSDIVKENNFWNRRVDPDKLEAVKNLGLSIKEGLKAFMEHFTPQTKLELGYYLDRAGQRKHGSNFIFGVNFTNDITGGSYSVPEYCPVNESGINKLKHMEKILKRIDGAGNYTPEAVNTTIYAKYEEKKLRFARKSASLGLFGEFLNKINGKFADAVSKTLGKTEKLSAKMEAERLKVRTESRLEQKLVEENKRTLERFLK